MNLITLEQVLQMHVLVARDTGGSAGLRDLGRLEATLATQQQNVFGKEVYASLTHKAAALIRGIIADHPFVDGNKRTAMLVGLTFLRINDIGFQITPGDLEDFAVKITTDNLAVESIANWLEKARTNK